MAFAGPISEEISLLLLINEKLATPPKFIIAARELILLISNLL